MSKTMCFLDMIDAGGGGGRLDLLTAGFDVLVVGIVWQMLDDYLGGVCRLLYPSMNRM